MMGAARRGAKRLALNASHWMLGAGFGQHLLERMTEPCRRLVTLVLYPLFPSGVRRL